MIKEVTYYDIICDRCGKSLMHDSESGEMVARDSERLRIGGKHYGPDRYELDEVTDIYVSKKGGKL